MIGSTRPGKLTQKTIWKDPPCYSWVEIHYFDWAMFNSFFVCLPEGVTLVQFGHDDLWWPAWPMLEKDPWRSMACLWHTQICVFPWLNALYRAISIAYIIIYIYLCVCVCHVSQEIPINFMKHRDVPVLSPCSSAALLPRSYMRCWCCRQIPVAGSRFSGSWDSQSLGVETNRRGWSKWPKFWWKLWVNHGESYW